MKKYIFTLIIFIFASGLVFAQNTECYNFSKINTNTQDSDILWQFIQDNIASDLNEMGSYYKPQRNKTKAFAFDLDNDGTKEIIGYNENPGLLGQLGFKLFILQKRDNKYIDIAELVNFDPAHNIYILKTKTNGFRNISYFHTTPSASQKSILFYQNDVYTSDIEVNHTKKFIRKLKYNNYLK